MQRLTCTPALYATILVFSRFGGFPCSCSFSWNCPKIDCLCWSFTNGRFLHLNSCRNLSWKSGCLILFWSYACGQSSTWSGQLSARQESGLARQSEAGTGPKVTTQGQKLPRLVLIEESIKYRWARRLRTGAIFFNWDSVTRQELYSFSSCGSQWP